MTFIQASPPSLTSSASQFQARGGVAEGYSTDMQSATRGLSNTLSGMPELGGFDGALGTLGRNLTIVMECYIAALARTSQGLLTTAQSIQALDANMASTLRAVELGLAPFTGYEVPIRKPAPPQPSAPWYDSTWAWVAGAAVVTVLAPEVTVGVVVGVGVDAVAGTAAAAAALILAA